MPLQEEPLRLAAPEPQHRAEALLFQPEPRRQQPEHHRRLAERHRQHQEHALLTIPAEHTIQEPEAR